MGAIASAAFPLSILEGLLTVVCGFLAYFTIYNGPDSVSWLTEEEKAYIRVKLAYDGNRAGMGASEEGSKRKSIIKAFSDWQVSAALLPIRPKSMQRD